MLKSLKKEPDSYTLDLPHRSYGAQKRLQNGKAQELPKGSVNFQGSHQELALSTRDENFCTFRMHAEAEFMMDDQWDTSPHPCPAPIVFGHQFACGLLCYLSGWKKSRA
jgi:hypothetical protein